MQYVTNPEKAAYVSVQNLFEDEDYAEQFTETMRRFNKGKKYDERKYYHFKLSCDRKDNVSPEEAHRFAEELTARLFPDCELRKKLTAGTPVRQHGPGWSFSSSDSARAESSLKTVSHIVKSGSYKGNSRSIMLCGTKKLMPLFTAGAGIEVRNIRIEEVAKK